VGGLGVPSIIEAVQWVRERLSLVDSAFRRAFEGSAGDRVYEIGWSAFAMKISEH
jgi:hypothetical protein